VFLDAVKVDLARLFCCVLFVLLDGGAPKARFMGRMTSDPYTRKKVEYPIAELTWVQRPQITWGSSASHLVAHCEASSKMRSLMP
jgi:hypothetical protein